MKFTLLTPINVLVIIQVDHFDFLTYTCSILRPLLELNSKHFEKLRCGFSTFFHFALNYIFQFPVQKTLIYLYLKILSKVKKILNFKSILLEEKYTGVNHSHMKNETQLKIKTIYSRENRTERLNLDYKVKLQINLAKLT